ncbi:uncharacterized protein [Dermacentor andersoni]|uniref:uncharacterized protein n=1 Tax=Dermacentor andersoni TaxID=34620 RepID=UPI003B3A37B6
MKPSEAPPPASGTQAKEAKAVKEKTGSRKGPKRDALPARHLKQPGASGGRDVTQKPRPEGHEKSVLSPAVPQPDAKVHTIRPPSRHGSKGSKAPNVTEAAATGHNRREGRVTGTHRAAAEGAAVASLPASQAGNAGVASTVSPNSPVSLPVPQARHSFGASDQPSSPPEHKSPLISGNIVAFPMEAVVNPPHLPGDKIAEEGPKPPPVRLAGRRRCRDEHA